jgi:hypothetical protein
MTKNNNDEISVDREISRRQFVKLAAAAGLLAGCASSPPVPTRSPTAAPTATPLPTPTSTQVPTPTSIQTPTPAPTATPTIRPTVAAGGPEIVKFYPDVPSRVIRARHAAVWDGKALAPQPIQQMLDAAITRLTGLNDAHEAWAALFNPSERIAIKVSTIDTSNYWTHVPLVMAVAERLQEAAIPPQHIVIFDRRDDELKRAGYTINQDGPGVRCYGTGYKNYTRSWKVLDAGVGLSDILLSCDAIINMPILKHHNHSGVTFAMKNHFGTFDSPSLFHRPRTGQAIVELNALPPIRDRTRLVIGDMLEICPISRAAGLRLKPAIRFS